MKGEGYLGNKKRRRIGQTNFRSTCWVEQRAFTGASGTRKDAMSGCMATHLKCVYTSIFIHIMRTNIVIDDKLMEQTLRLTGLKTKKEAVELGLRTLLRLTQQQKIRNLRGKLNWQGDLEAMRADK
jgi:Arc/MetJ family transcription regulator